jgi:hypothetical protein
LITLRRELRLTFTDDPKGHDLSIKDLFDILDLCRSYQSIAKFDLDDVPAMGNVFQLLGHIEAVLQRPITTILDAPDAYLPEEFPL